MNGTGNRSGKVLEQLGLEEIAARLRDLSVPADALTWTRFLGSLALVLVVLLFLSGAFMAFYYTPAPGGAYDSVSFAQYDLPFGDVVRGTHHYAWNLLLAVLGLHLARGFLVGAYKAPRQFLWVSGVLILLIMPTFLITGDLLPWDQKGYWTTQVRTSIISSVPIAGDFLVRLAQGGPRIGIVTLTRFYAIHIVFLPPLLLLLIAAHFHFLRHGGLSEPLRGDSATRRRVHFFPSLVNRWLLLFLVSTIAIGLIAHYWPAPLGDPADPTDTNFVPAPEWWVLFLNQLVTIFTGPLALFGTVIIPGGLAVLLITLPFIDRSPERRPAHRWKALLIATVILVFLIVLSVMSYTEHFMKPHV